MRKALIAICLGSILFFGCRKEPFSYQSEWLTPIFNTSLGIEDLIPDSLRQTNQDGFLDLVVAYEENMDSLLSVMEVPDSLSELSVSLSQLVLDNRSYTDTITLAEIYPPAILLNGRTTTLDAQDITSDESTEIDVTEQFFTSATFEEGYLDLTIHNDLPVEVEEVEFELLNSSDESNILSGLFQNIPAFGMAQQSFDLSGKKVEGKMLAKLKRIKTKASSGPVLIEADKGIRLELEVRDLKPSEATAIFPAQNLVEREEETTYNFGGPEITTMRLKKGTVIMEVYSSINEEIILEYQVPQSKHVETGEPLVKTFTIPAAENGVPSQINEEIPIGEYEITYKGKDINSPPFTNTFYSILNARIEYTGLERTLSLSDSIYIKFGLVDVEPELAIGDFGKRTYRFTDPINVPAFSDISGTLSLEDARLDLSFENTFGMEATIEVDKLSGTNSRNSSSVQLFSPELEKLLFVGRGVNVLTHVRPYVTTVSLDKTNSNFKLFLENIPNRIEPDFSITTRPFGSNNYQDFIFDDSYLKTKVSLVVPMDIGMDGFTLVKKQAFSLDTVDVENINSAELKLLVDNHFPWFAKAKIEFLDEDDQIIHSVWGMAEDVVESGVLDQNDDMVKEAKRSTLSTLVDKEVLDQISSAKKVRVYITFDTKDGNRYKIYDNYYVDVKLVSQFNYENN